MPPRFLTARVLRRVIYVLAVVVLLLAAVQSYQDLLAAQRRSAELGQRIAVVEGEIVRLQRASEAVRSDPETMERVARQQLGLVREGEVVLMLPRPADEPPTTIGQAPRG